MTRRLLPSDPRLAVGLVVVVTTIWLASPALAAQSPFGVGLPDQGAGTGGVIPWIATLQKQFYRELTAALKDLRESGHAFWWLAGLSFAYGVVHAAGPGHGKVVISSYLMANEESARRGVAIAFMAAIVQSAMAVAIVGVAAVLLNLTSVAMTDTARFFEIGSYGLITALGLVLLLRKVRGLMAMRKGHVHDAHCGHSHAPAPDDVKKAHGLGGAVAAVLSVGIRPCSGALIVLVFALAQGILWAGIASTFLMGVGTALTIATLAVIAVYAKGLASRLAGADSYRALVTMTVLEIGGALMITIFGLLLLAGALSG